MCSLHHVLTLSSAHSIICSLPHREKELEANALKHSVDVLAKGTLRDASSSSEIFVLRKFLDVAMLTNCMYVWRVWCTVCVRMSFWTLPCSLTACTYGLCSLTACTYGLC
jgi:hypothetical protein